MESFELGNDTAQYQCIKAGVQYQMIVSYIKSNNIKEAWILWHDPNDKLKGLKISMCKSINNLEKYLSKIQEVFFENYSKINNAQIDGSGMLFCPFYLYLEKK